MKVFLGILLGSMLTGCGSDTDDVVDHFAHEVAMDLVMPDPGHDMSLYQLESIWSTQDDEEVKLKALRGRIRIVAMTYTSCEVACPRIVASMKKIQREVASDHVGFVLVSIDPKRDTPATLQAYANKMDLDESDWTLLTSKSDNVLELAALLGVRYKAMPDGEYAHSNIISVLDKSGVLVYQQNGLGPDLTATTIKAVENLIAL